MPAPEGPYAEATPARMSDVQPLSLTTNPRLDAALANGFDAWLATSKEVGIDGTVRWLLQRAAIGEHAATVRELLSGLHEGDDPDEAAALYAELGDVLLGNDDVMAESLFEAVLARGIAASDAETIEDAVVHLAELAEEGGDVLTAAEYYIDFLNWRREVDHSSDPESVLNAFDELVRLAELDGAQEAAATFGFRQAQYQRLVDAEDDTASVGDWEAKPDPYVNWA